MVYTIHTFLLLLNTHTLHEPLKLLLQGLVFSFIWIFRKINLWHTCFTKQFNVHLIKTLFVTHLYILQSFFYIFSTFLFFFLSHNLIHTRHNYQSHNHCIQQPPYADQSHGLHHFQAGFKSQGYYFGIR